MAFRARLGRSGEVTVDPVKRQIIGMGGGGFLMEPENPLLDQYILAQTGRTRPRVCFVPTASGDSENAIERFYTAFRKIESVPTHLSLFKPPLGDLGAFVAEQDVLYVGGGNTKNLIALWREWGLDRIVREAWMRGTVLCGVSAGSICWFEQGVTDSITGSLTALSCLGLLPGSHCPHYDGESERRPAYHRLLTEGKLRDGYAADDGAALHFVGDRLEAVVSSRPAARGYRVSLVEGRPVETPLATRYLG